MSLGSPSLSRVQVSPPSVLFQMPLPVPPERTIHGVRWWSQKAAYRMRGLVASMLRSDAPLVAFIPLSSCVHVLPPSVLR